MTLFCSRSHTWLQLIAPSKYRIGFTRRGLESLGSVIDYTLKADNSTIQKDDTLIKFNWQGYGHTECDELYHAVWDTKEGILEFRSPLSGTVTGYNNKELHNPIEEDWLVEITSNDATQLQHNHFLSETNYDQFVLSESERGLFQEQ